MKRTSYPQYAIVQADTAQQLTERLNSKLYELREYEPTVTFEGLIARVNYWRTEEKEEQQKVEPVGYKFRCKECPLFEPTRTKSGKIDRRTDLGTCPLSTEPGRLAMGTSKACKRLYDMIKEREVELCLKEEE